MLLKYIIFVLLSQVAVHFVSGTAIEVLQMDDKTCVFDIYSLNEYGIMEVRWDGRQLPRFCKNTFYGRSEIEPRNLYKVCVEAITYDIKSCGFKLIYYNDNRPREEYHCYDGLPPKFCADEDKYLDIEFTARSSSTSSVTLKVSTTLTYEYSDYSIMIYVILSIIVVSCAAVTCIILFVLYRRRNKNSFPGTIIRTAPVPRKLHDSCFSSFESNIRTTGQGVNLAAPTVVVDSGSTSTPASPPMHVK